MTEYEYYISGQKFPVLWIQYEKLNIPALNVNDFEVEIDHPINYVLGVNNSFISNNTNALLYPNPTQNSINIELNDQETYTLSILSN
ncbi:MAG: hypothetical protein KatS3mg027_1790 [Bacteroidia bacterium]|nr:MAG: hypothetical protein KatS3mg027_1790 [Bacteroidia bacterium]